MLLVGTVILLSPGLLLTSVTGYSRLLDICESSDERRSLEIPTRDQPNLIMVCRCQAKVPCTCIHCLSIVHDQFPGDFHALPLVGGADPPPPPHPFWAARRGRRRTWLASAPDLEWKGPNPDIRCLLNPLLGISRLASSTFNNILSHSLLSSSLPTLPNYAAPRSDAHFHQNACS